MKENMEESINNKPTEATSPVSIHSKETLQSLADLGYPKDFRNRLTRAEAAEILESQTSYKEGMSQPKIGEDHDAKELATLRKAWDEALDRMSDSTSKEEQGEVLEKTMGTREEVEKYLKENKQRLSVDSIFFVELSIATKKKAEEIASKKSN